MTNSDEVRTQYVAAMGAGLGELFYALWNEVAFLHVEWSQYKQLYGGSHAKIAVLNNAAPFFFGYLDEVLWEHVLLHIARLTDPCQSGGTSNLTLVALEAALAQTPIAADVAELVKRAVDAGSFARDWRNRLLAHPDLDVALKASAKPLASASRRNVADALEAIRDLMNGIESHYRDGEVDFESFRGAGDAGRLLSHLELVVGRQEETSHQVARGTRSAETMKPLHGSQDTGLIL